VPAAFALLALVLVGFELLTRRIEQQLPPYGLWHDVLTTGKWHQLRKLRHEPPVDVLLAGSSQMLMAVDPMTLVQPPLRCYNAALYRGVPCVMTPWLEDVVLSAVRPRTVVWGISVLDLNDRGEFHRGVEERFNAAVARRRGPATFVKVHSALIRHGGVWRSPLRAVRLLTGHGEPVAKPVAAVLGPMGKGVEYLDFDTYQLSESKARFVQDEIVNSFSMGGRQTDALRQGIRAAQRTGANVMLVEMPATQAFYDMYPHRNRDVDDARALLARTAEELGIEWIPVTELPQDWFADPVHLNGRGMQAWTQILAARLHDRVAV